MRGLIMIRFAPLVTLPLRRIVTSRGVIVSRRRTVARRVGSARLSIWSRIVRLFAPLAALPLGRTVTAWAVIGSPFIARWRLIARRILVFVVAFDYAFRPSTVSFSRLS
jgi:hypothetical protein